MRGIPAFVLGCTVLSAACSPSLPSPTPEPAATLRPATAFIEGENQLPDNRYLFLEYFTHNDGGVTDPASLCPDAAMIDFPGYSFSDRSLSFPGELPDDVSLLGLVGVGTSNAGAMGGGVSSGLNAIDGLPYALPNGAAIIHAAYEDGTVVAEIDGAFFYLSPGESWARRSEWDPAPECHRISITRLSNFGLLAPEELNRPD